MSPAGGPHIKNATDPVRRENRTGPCRQRCHEAGIGFASCNAGGMPAVDAEQTQGARVWRRIVRRMRSEEHQSALQSLMRNSYAVLCLKKKNTQPYIERL